MLFSLTFAKIEILAEIANYILPQAEKRGNYKIKFSKIKTRSH